VQAPDKAGDLSRFGLGARVFPGQRESFRSGGISLILSENLKECGRLLRFWPWLYKHCVLFLGVLPLVLSSGAMGVENRPGNRGI
jgi:hypothetical protein